MRSSRRLWAPNRRAADRSVALGRPAPGRGPRPGPPSGGAPDTAPWGLSARNKNDAVGAAVTVSNPMAGRSCELRWSRPHA